MTKIIYGSELSAELKENMRSKVEAWVSAGMRTPCLAVDVYKRQVLQKNVLFSGTIADNIRWGNKDATLEEVKHVCHLACADEFIEQMPDGYDTCLLYTSRCV